jgi:hypothetical protein
LFAPRFDAALELQARDVIGLAARLADGIHARRLAAVEQSAIDRAAEHAALYPTLGARLAFA